MEKIIRITTVPISLGGLLKGQLRFMSSKFNVVGISSEGKIENGKSEIQVVGDNEGIPVISVEMTRKITPLKDLKAVYQLYKIFKIEKPTIVHSHTPKAGTLAMLAAKLAGVPHRLHTIAGLPLLVATGAKRKLLDIVERATYGCATKIYPNSYGLKDIIIENKYTTANKLKVIGKGSSNGIDTSHFDPSLFTEQKKLSLREQLGIAQADLVFIFVGRIVRDKGIEELINAFRKLNTETDNVKLLLVGTYEKELDPISLVCEEEINTNPNIISVGWQQDVRPFFSISDILTFPSYREGFPNVVMQAAAMGLVSIVSDINGCNEIVEEGFNGKIIPVKDEEALLNAMRSLRDNPQEIKSTASNARKSICKNYERQFVWNELLEEYNNIIG